MMNQAYGQPSTYRFNNLSTDSLTTGNVIARLLRDEQNARTVFSACVQPPVSNAGLALRVTDWNDTL